MSLRLSERVEPLFLEAVELEGPARDDFLRHRCGADDELYHELASLLQADDDIRETWSGLKDLPLEPPTATPEVPGYSIVGALGRGGMGSVYSAVGLEPPFERVKFAVKVLHEHRATKRGRRRFADEQRALAKLDHRFIARLYSVGELPDRRPYLVMEHVDGVPLDQHCHRRRLPLEDRLRLFRDICSAVFYAHQNLVVHRDLKPSNILVDPDGTPRLVDFGIAKLLADKDRAGDTATLWPAPLTPSFASPEQLSGGEITTASDIYSLGRLLYYLLTDQLPPIARSGESEGPSLRSVEWNDSEPETSLSRAARLRRVEPRRLRRELAGDLSFIVAKCLRADPAERYASARELSDDVGRYLAQRPVVARRGTWRYWIARFCLRHRVALWGTLSTLTVLLLTVGLWLQSRQVDDLKQRGSESEGLLRRLTGPAEDPLMEPGSVAQTVASVLALDLPEADKQILIEGTRRLYEPDSKVLARLLEVFGRVRRDVESGLETVELAQNTSALGLRLGTLLYQQGQFESAVALFQQTSALSELVGESPAVLADHLEMLGESLSSLDRFEEAATQIQRALDLRARDTDPQDTSGLVSTLLRLGSLHFSQGAFQKAVDAHRQALSLLAAEAPEQAVARAEHLTAMAVAIVELGDAETAIAAAREALEIQSHARGPRHIATLHMRHNLVSVLGRAGRFAETVELAELNLEMAEAVLGTEHPRLAHLLLSLAAGYAELGRADRCVTPAQRAVDLRRASLPEGHSLTAFASSRLGSCLTENGRSSEAAAILERSLQTLRRASAPNPEWIEVTERRLARARELGDGSG